MLICLVFDYKKCKNTSVSTPNNDLLRIQNLGYHCKMWLNPSRTTQGQEFFFMRKTNMSRKLLLHFKNAIIKPTLFRSGPAAVSILSYSWRVHRKYNWQNKQSNTKYCFFCVSYNFLPLTSNCVSSDVICAMVILISI